MQQERTYTNQVSAEHIKQFSQYFTIPKIADFMAMWACKKAKKVLDPSVGNSVFFQSVRKTNRKCQMRGFEIDSSILNFFGNPTKSEIIQEDYLSSDWNEKYDGIVCNPPYNRFQSVKNRHDLLASINKHTGIKHSGYTNQYILFLAKSIHQMSDDGRLAYIIPTEFLNSSYGTAIKKIFVKQRLVRAIVNFQNNNELFFNAVTTCCLLFLDKAPKQKVDFYNIENIEELDQLDIDHPSKKSKSVDYEILEKADKWRKFLNNEKKADYKNLTLLSNYCSVTRGIATGDNDFFCFSKSKAKENSIPRTCLSRCICRSADVKSNVFTNDDFETLADCDKTVFLLDIDQSKESLIKPYIVEGATRGVNQKYLPKTRKVWFTMEKKDVAPIWVTTASRDGIKVIRNLSSAKNLTTFHSVFVKDLFRDYTDVIFCYLLTPIAQTILRENRKELGNGLEKFQPGDLNGARVIDFLAISKEDIKKIKAIAKNLSQPLDKDDIDELNKIFTPYIMR